MSVVMAGECTDSYVCYNWKHWSFL